MTRLIGLGSAVIDLVLTVPAMPVVGGDVLATRSGWRAGGGANVLVAATLAGLPSTYAGGHGTGPCGDLLRAALEAAGIAVLHGPDVDLDTGVCVVLVDGAGERTFVTTVGAEGHLRPQQWAGIECAPGDYAYLSGYDLTYPHAADFLDWISTSSRFSGALLVLDPGPLVGTLDASVLDRVLSRYTWVSLSLDEAQTLTGRTDAASAGAALLQRAPDADGVVVRTGSDGCVLAQRQQAGPLHIAGVPVSKVVDTNGAGDVHVGTFLAGLARGLTARGAAAEANAAAAAWVADPAGHTGPARGTA